MLRIQSVFVLCAVVAGAASGLVLPRPAAAQLDSLVAIAAAESPGVRVARERVEAARARVGPVRALPDPMLGLGLMNVPITDPGLRDFMTMTTLSVQQRLPYPGKLTLAAEAADADVRASEARMEAALLEVTTAVRKEYYELAFIDAALEVVARNQDLTTTLGQLSERRFASLSEDRSAVLDASIIAADLVAEVAELSENRRAVLARLNALLGRPSETPVERARISEPIVRAAAAGSEGPPRFTASAARLVDSPLPPLPELQQRAVDRNPVLAAHEAEIAAQSKRVELAGKAHLPDFDVWLQYGQRVGNADMMSVMVSVPLPLHRGARQDQEAAGARADLATMHAEHDVMANDLRAEVAERVADLERLRTQIALLVGSVVPQGRSILDSSIAAYRAGSGSLADVIDERVTLYEYEITYLRALSDFASELADLETTVGGEVIP